jgi:succinoglycan biosynthesis transport protein ExoP
MLNIHTRQSADRSPTEEQVGIAELFLYISAIFRRQVLIILPIMILVIGLAVLYVLVTPPTYTARASMIIGKGTVQVQLGGILSEVPVELESQVQLIQSEAVALAVARKLNLANDPEFAGRSVGMRGLMHSLRSALLPPSVPSTPNSDPARSAASDALDRLKVTRKGYVIDIEFSSPKPELAARVANAFAEAYIEDQLKYKHQGADEASSWLKNQMEELREQSLRADEAVTQFKTRYNIVAADGKLINDQQITLLNGQLVVAREKTAETLARLDRIQTVISANSPDTQAIATVTDSLNNPIIVKLRAQYLEFTSRESMWSREYGTGHLAVVNLRRQIREIQSAIQDELRRIAETYKSEYEIARQRQAGLEKRVADAVSRSQETSQVLATLHGLESSAETYRGLYRTALQRNTELVQKQSFPGVEARVIVRASTPAQQSSPTPLVILGASAMAGLLLGFGAGALRASLDRLFRAPTQLEAALQTRCLAVAPIVKASSVRRYGSPQQSAPLTIRRDKSIIWEVVDQPLSRFAEAMRAIRLGMHLNGPTKSIVALGFTSSLPKEGKSTIASAFSLLMAQAGTRTILLDCDLRNPALSAKLAPNAEYGLLEVIEGKKQLEDVVWTDPTTDLIFVPAVVGRVRAAESTTILSSPALRTFVEKLREKYDCVVLDLSPVAPIIDVQATAGLVDAYVFVVEWSRTKIDVAELALSKATVVQENLLGAVLNKVDFKVLRQYEGYRREYYSDKHYGQYGQV